MRLTPRTRPTVASGSARRAHTCGQAASLPPRREVLDGLLVRIRRARRAARGRPALERVARHIRQGRERNAVENVVLRRVRVRCALRLRIGNRVLVQRLKRRRIVGRPGLVRELPVILNSTVRRWEGRPPCRPYRLETPYVHGGRDPSRGRKPDAAVGQARPSRRSFLSAPQW